MASCDLTNTLYLPEKSLKSTMKPHYDGVVDLGCRADHCWNGHHERGDRYVQMYVPGIFERIQKSVFRGADLTGWRY